MPYCKCENAFSALFCKAEAEDQNSHSKHIKTQEPFKFFLPALSPFFAAIGEVPFIDLGLQHATLSSHIFCNYYIGAWRPYICLAWFKNHYQIIMYEFLLHNLCSILYRRGTDVWDGRTDLFLLTVKTSVISTA